MDGYDPSADAEELARELIAFEADGRVGAAAFRSAGERVLQGLREHLGRVLGREGVVALEVRAVDLAGRRYRFLRGGTIGGSGSVAPTVNQN